MIAGLDTCHAGPGLLDDVGCLMTEHHRDACRHVAVQKVDIGMAQPGVRVADQDLVLLRPVEVKFLDLHGFSDFAEHCGRRFHWLSSVVVTRPLQSVRPFASRRQERARPRRRRSAGGSAL
jgi:hypothetical protein